MTATSAHEDSDFSFYTKHKINEEETSVHLNWIMENFACISIVILKTFVISSRYLFVAEIGELLHLLFYLYLFKNCAK